MKKTLALVLALVMVVSIFAMIPVTTSAAAPASVLGWEVLNDGYTTITQESGSTVKLEGQGYYGETNTAAMMVSTNKVDISNGFTLTLSNLDGMIPAADSWLIVGFTDTKQTTFTNATQSGACVMFKPSSQRLQPYTIGGDGYVWENWGPGVKPDFWRVDGASSTVIGSGSNTTFSISIAKSGSIYQFYGIDGTKVTNTLEDNYNSGRIAAIDKTISTLGGEAYVWVALSQKTSNTEFAKTSVVVNAIEAAPSSVRGWEVANGANTWITAVGDNQVKLTGKGYYGTENTTTAMISSSKVKIADGYKFAIGALNGFVPSNDCWIIVGFSTEKNVKVTNRTDSSACVMIKPTGDYRIQPYTMYGYNARDSKTYTWENWGPGVKKAFWMVDTTKTIGSGEDFNFAIEIANSGSIKQFYVDDGTKMTNLLEDNYNNSRINGVDEAIKSLGEEAYVFVVMSQRTTSDSNDNNTVSIVVDALTEYSMLEAETEVNVAELIATPDAVVTYRSEAPLSEFKGLFIDGVEVPKKYYTVREGSTIIELKASYFDYIANGEHVLAIESVNGVSEIAITVEGSQEKPIPTGDNFAIYAVVAAISVAVVATSVVVLRKKEEQF